MASLDVVMLSSSPQRPFTTFNMPSSSPLPSLSELTHKRSQLLRTGSRAAPIPQNALASFTSAAALFKATSSKDLLGADAILSFEMDTEEEGNSVVDLPKLSKAKPRKPTTKRAEDGAEKVAKAPRKTATKKDAVDEETLPRKARKPRAKVMDQDGQGQAAKEPASRKPHTKKADKETNDEGESKEKPVRKAKAKKVDGESQTKLSQGQVTKPSSKSKSDKVDKALKSKRPESEPAQAPDPFIDSLDYGLVEAVKRRTDWTPPAPTGKITDLTLVTVDHLNGISISGDSLHSAESTKGFKDLFGNFGFTNLDNNAVGKKSSETEAPQKRKFIELVKTSVSTAAVASPKEKASKKKARTITEQATSAYAEEKELPTKPAPLLQYFSYQTTERDTNDGLKVPPKPRSKSPVKGPPKAKKGSAQAPILLSPESALKQSVNQDFVFGTSSQLAREDSPTLLRDLHEAMQASNEADEDDPFADSIHESGPVVFAKQGRAVPSTKRNLWSAAARDGAGELLEVEMVDLVDSPVIRRQPKLVAVPETAEPLGKQVDGEVWHDVEEVCELAPTAEARVLPRTVGPVEAAIRAELPSSPPSTRLANGLSPKTSQTAKNTKSPSRTSKSSAKALTKAAKSADLEKPDFSSYTTAQLAKEIASYRFKPVKNRDQMITLLEKCWEGKNRIALGALGTNVMSSAPIESSKSAAPAASQSSSPKRPRGRPRKESVAVPAPKAKVGRPKKSNSVEYLEMDSDTPLSQIRTPKKSKKKAKEPAEDISDSDTQITPSPPRRHASQMKTPPLSLKLSTSVDVDTSPELSPTSSQTRLFTHITRAVRSASPSKDVSKPSWHEKILLYDPIVLEDLTTWLNTGALEKVGWDGEVEPKEVKKWCESKSICCLWRENLRGVVRSRY
jgi:hypothetical protein